MTKRHSEVLREEYADYRQRFRRGTVRNLGGIGASGLWAVGSEALLGDWDLSAISILTGGYFALRIQRDAAVSSRYKRLIKTQEHIETYKDSLPRFELNYMMRTTIAMMHQDAKKHQHDVNGCNTKQGQVLRGLAASLRDCQLEGVIRPVAYMLDQNRHLIADVRNPNEQEENILVMGRLLDTYMPTTPDKEGQGIASDRWVDYLRQYSTDDALAGNVNALWSQTPAP